MKKIYSALALALLITGNQFAARSECFRPYHAEISNKSGGIATIQKTHGISGISRNQVMENSTAMRVMIKKLGAEFKVMAGPEGNKTMREVAFYCKEPSTTLTAQVILNPKGLTTNGFYTENKPYDVIIMNDSGGILEVLDTVATGVIDHKIADGKSAKLTVRPGGYIIVLAGAENRKVKYRINFAEQTGINPTVTFTKRSFTNRGIQSKNVEIKTHRVYSVRNARRTPAQLAAETVLTKRQAKYEQIRPSKMRTPKIRRGAAPAAAPAA